MTTKIVKWQPSSSFGWIDVDRDEAKRVRELLGLFKAPEAIDPHGILPLQLAISDSLFPGMSTQHTRARYVFFAAWHAQRLAADTSNRSPYESLRVDELDLMRSLLDSEDRGGVFGKRSRETTKTLPTGVYWTSLQRWGLIPPDMSIADVRPRMQANARYNSTAQFSDDALGSTSGRLLPVDCPKAPNGFPTRNQTLAMTQEEADYFIDRVTATCPGSFLARVMSQPALAEGLRPWSVDPDVGGQPLVDARCFSELIHPARLMYAKLLATDARKAGVNLDDLEAAIDADVDEWLDECDGRQPELERWSSTRLPILLNDPQIRLSGARRAFISSAVRIAAIDLESAIGSDELEQQVRRIELTVKRRQGARLTPGEPFRRWLKQPSRIASARLDYRWPNVQSFVRDMDRA